nr:hypothetical protein [Streptomyces sp. 846.5]
MPRSRIVGVEILSETHRALPVREAASAAYRTAADAVDGSAAESGLTTP